MGFLNEILKESTIVTPARQDGRKLYENLTWFCEDDITQGRALICIRDGLVNHALVADPEINLSATLIRLARMK